MTNLVEHEYRSSIDTVFSFFIDKFYFLISRALQISPFMAAIIRRHRFVILFIIYFLILTIFIWYFRRKDQSVSDNASISYNNKNSYDEMQMFHLKRQKFSDSIKEGRSEPASIKNSPEVFPFVKKSKKANAYYQVEELRQLISKQINEELTVEFMPQIDENFMVGEEKAYINPPTAQHSKVEFSAHLNRIIIVDTNDLNLVESNFTASNSNKKVSLTFIQNLGDAFPTQNQKSKGPKAYVTSSSLDLTGSLSLNKHILPNESLPTEYSTDKKTVLLIDTPGCKIPKLDPWDPTIKHLIELQEPYQCPGPPLFMKSNPGGSITLDKAVLETYYNITPEELICHYQPIYRIPNKETVREITVMFGSAKQLEFEVPLNEDFVTTSCTIKGKNYEHYFPLVRLKEDVEKERNASIPPNPAINVILVGIDSVSKLNFLRHFPRTHAFLNSKLKPFEMNGYTKVADNTFPNLVPMLTGEFVEHWWNETLMNTTFFDDIDFIWKEFAKRGYRTFYAEDNPFTGTFNYFKRGFYNSPTDYYFRPMALVLERFRMMTEQDGFCLNSQLEFDFIFDYLKDFVQTMGPRPYFGFAMVSNLTHDVLNYAGWADEPTERLLEGLLTTGTLNNTILVLFSDHGLRYGKICHTYIGKFEERLPLMYIHVPQWFLDQNPDIEKSMKVNQDRLITLLDIHATMIHLLDLSKSQAERSTATLGRSLFEEIPSTRTCADAYIEQHWCPCQIYDIVPLNNPKVINASQAIVDDINSKLEPYGGICETLEVDTIMDSRVGKANDIMVRYLGTENLVINRIIFVGDNVTSFEDYMLTLSTKPGGAVFEGTVRHNPVDHSYNVLGLNRISMYGNTSWCIDSQKMKIFCYCKIQQLT